MKNIKLLRPILTLAILAIAGLIGSYVILPIWADKTQVENEVLDAQTRNDVQAARLNKLIQDAGNLIALKQELDSLELSTPRNDEFEDFIVQIADVLTKDEKLESFSSTGIQSTAAVTPQDINAASLGFNIAILVDDISQIADLLKRLQKMDRSFLVKSLATSLVPESGQTRIVINGLVFSIPGN